MRPVVAMVCALAMCFVGGAGAAGTMTIPRVGAAPAKAAHSHRFLVASAIARGLQGTPLARYGFVFEAAGHRWNVNPAFVAAIAGTESSFGEAACGANYFGWNSCRSAAPWSTVRDSIAYVTRDLRVRYMNGWGLRDLLSIGLTYCGKSCGARWAAKTASWMQDRFRSGPEVVYP